MRSHLAVAVQSKLHRTLSRLIIGAVAFGVTACGSGSGGGDHAVATPSSAGSALSEATASVAKLSKPPTDIGVTEPLKDPSKLTGKTFVYMSCAAPICQLYVPDLEAAAKVLGVKVQTINTGATPDTINSAWNQLASLSPKPAAVIAPANPPELFRSQLREVLDAGTNVVLFNTPDPAPPGVSAVVYPPRDSSTLGRATAEFIYADAQGNPGDSLYIDTPQFTALNGGPANYKSRMRELCSTCKVDTLNVQANEIGRTIPSKVVSYLQSHPNVKYVVPQFGDLEIGVPQAIKGAGLPLPKLVTAEAEPANLALLKQGLQYADAPHFLDYLFWLAVDSAARAVLGQKIDVPAAPIQWLRKADVTFDPNTQHPPFGTDFRSQFEKLWAGR
jgi:ABC-type sugar transport system substrate-binding protein